MRQQMVSQANSTATQVYFLQPACNQTAAPRIFSDFGQSSTCRPWVPVNATYLLMSEIAPSLADLPVTMVPASEKLRHLPMLS